MTTESSIGSTAWSRMIWIDAEPCMQHAVRVPV